MSLFPKRRADWPGAYTRNQLIAHWMVAILALVQLLFGGDMAEAYAAASEAGAWPLSGAAWMHGGVGLTILALMLWRLGMRLRHGAPPPPQDLPAALRALSRANHFAFYGVLIAMPLAGLWATLTLNDAVARLHAAAAGLLLALIALHLAGAILHMVKPGSTAWRRMLRTDPSGETARR